MKRVVIVQRVLLHYRIPFFELLREQLRASDIELVLLVSRSRGTARTKNDEAVLPWAVPIKNRHLRLGRRELIWQPALKELRSADLVIVEQASRLLLNYVLIIRRHFGGPRVAFWGHGVNRNVHLASRTGEVVKRWMTRRPDWWFCYTEGTARVVESVGFPHARVTVAQNSTDTTLIRGFKAAQAPSMVAAAREELGVDSGPVALSLGSIYPSKRPEFLLAAADWLRHEEPHFQLVVIGDGPSRPLFDAAAVTRPWLHVLGVKTGVELVRLASSCDLVLNPGLVGLSVLDAFALELPVVTVELPIHSPEIEYLEDGANGVVVPDDSVSGYGHQVLRLIRDPDRLATMKAQCRVTAERYTIENMTERFVLGIEAAIAENRDRPGISQTK